MLTNIVVVRSVSKRYFGWKSRDVFTDVTFSIGKGECCAIVGENGSGKSTLLRVVGGMIPKTNGFITISGEIGYVPETSINFQNLTLAEHLEFYRKMSGGNIDRLHHLNVLNLPLTGKPLKKFSKGMKRKFDIVRALISNPDVLILDEPFEGLDPSACHEITELLREEKKNGRTILLASHDLAYVQKIADHTLLMKDGEIRVITGWESGKIAMHLSPSSIGEIEEVTRDLNCNVEKTGSSIRVVLGREDSIKLLGRLKNRGIEPVKTSTISLEEAYLEEIKNSSK